MTDAFLNILTNYARKRRFLDSCNLCSLQLFQLASNIEFCYYLSREYIFAFSVALVHRLISQSTNNLSLVIILCQINAKGIKCVRVLYSEALYVLLQTILVMNSSLKGKCQCAHP
jgi:hypothetical protein